MSNLYKWMYTAKQQESVRVIDSNKKSEERILEQMKTKNVSFEMLQDGQFHSLGEVVPEQVAQKEPTQILEEAKEEAQRILEEANQTAKQVTFEAEEAAGDLKLKAQQDGYQQGYDDGHEEAVARLEEEYQGKKEKLERYQEQLEQDYQRQRDELEPQLLSVVLSVIEKVFHIHFDDEKEIMLYLIQNTMLGIESSKNYKVRVSALEYPYLVEKRSEIEAIIGTDASLEIVSDPKYEQNKCVIETETGVFDCGMGVQFENLMKSLRSLCS